jgi:Metallo-peptidase family M12B Reprolysin-like
MRLLIFRVNRIFLLLPGLTLCLCCPVFAVQDRQSPDRLWRILDKNAITITASQLETLGQAIPRRFELVSLNQQRLRQRLNPGNLNARTTNLPQQPSGGVEITLPLPDATFTRFLVHESSIMEPALERQFPNFKSYSGQGLDDPAMTVRFDQSPAGFHAIILVAGRTFYIDPFPLQPGDTQTHVSFSKDDFSSNEKQIRCFVGADPEGSVPGRRGSRPLPLSNGSVRRTYRLAVAATGEYTRFHGGTVTGAMHSILKTINRVNAIYENELAIHLRLIGNETKLIYTDPKTDPYTNSNAIKLLSENQNNLDKEIGSQNYDIGHVFAVSAGGVAILRSVGKAGTKAKGVTGSPKPVGDPFDVDYVAHEIGHQFGANHTFNATTAGCGSGNRNPPTAYEPGSGSTIMAYAGICGESDLQRNSHSYFHGASLQEIIDYVTSDEVKAVPITAQSNNRPPSVMAGQKFVVPKATPFSLRATGTDPDGDSITYSWEQFDLGDPSPPEDDVATLRPLFRSFNPVRDPVRFFPRLEDLVADKTSFGEALPVRQRDMNFRITARDNRAGAGGVSFDTVLVSVVMASGPFVVTQPSSGTTWTIGSSQTITWDVAGTKDAPISCNNVRISLSADGGKTFTLLQPVAPNTGTAKIIVPNTPTVNGRILVEGVDHAFFNVSRGDLKIVKPVEGSKE